MTAVLLEGNGGFDRLEVRDDLPVPEPRFDDVLVRISAAGVNNTDINTRIGWYAPDALPTTDTDAAVPTKRADVGWSGDVPTFPRIQGADACGHIVAVGSGVEPSRIGERVIVEPVFRNHADPLAPPIYFGSEVDGGSPSTPSCPLAMRRGWMHLDQSNWLDPWSYPGGRNMLGRARVVANETSSSRRRRSRLCGHPTRQAPRCARDRHRSTGKARRSHDAWRRPRPAARQQPDDRTGILAASTLSSTSSAARRGRNC